MIHVTLKSARDWYGSLTDDALRAELSRLERMVAAGMADDSDRRMVDAELRRREGQA